MKILIYWLIIVIGFAMILSACQFKPEDKVLCKVKSLSTEVVYIVKIPEGYKPGEKIYKDIYGLTQVVEVVEILGENNYEVYTNIIKPLIIDSTLKYGDTIIIQNNKQSVIIKKHNGKLETKYILTKQ